MKKKGDKEKKGKAKEGKRNKREIAFVGIRGNERERKKWLFPSNLFNFEEIGTLIRSVDQILPISLPLKSLLLYFAIQIKKFSSSKSLPFLSLNFFSSKHILKKNDA